MSATHDPEPEQDRIWEHFQVQDPSSFAASTPRLRFLARWIPPGSRVLNIGIGGGQFEQAAIDRGMELYVLDPSVQSVEQIRARFELGNRARVGYCQAPPFENDFFDAVVASEVLEHLDDSVLLETLGQIQRILRPGGLFVGTVPAREDLSLNRFYCPRCRQSFHRWGHRQSFDSERLGQLLATHLKVTALFEKQFVHWPQLNWRGKLIAAARLSLDPWVSAGKNLCFQARRADTVSK